MSNEDSLIESKVQPYQTVAMQAKAKRAQHLAELDSDEHAVYDKLESARSLIGILPSEVTAIEARDARLGRK